MFKHELHCVSGTKAWLWLDLMCKEIQDYLECTKKKSHDTCQLHTFLEENEREHGVPRGIRSRVRSGRKKRQGALPAVKFASLFYPAPSLGKPGWFVALGPADRHDREGETGPAPSPSPEPVHQQPMNRSSALRYYSSEMQGRGRAAELTFISRINPPLPVCAEAPLSLTGFLVSLESACRAGHQTWKTPHRRVSDLQLQVNMD